MNPRRSILIIDDSPVDRDLFRRLAKGFAWREGETGRAGLAQMRSSRPDCVLLDLNLPDMDGLDLLREILREPDPCPVIVVTAYGNEQVAVEAMKSGATDYVVKGTLSPEVLCKVIENAFEKHALQRELDHQRLALAERNRELELALERERNARAEAEESRSRYRMLAEAMPQVVWTAVLPNGEWDYVNQSWHRLTGASAENALGGGWLDFIDPQDLPRVKEEWAAAVSKMSPVELEFRLRATANTMRWQLMRALPLVQDGRAKWLGTLTDIEDQRRAERILHQRQKLESIGVLAGGVAHDFNNLLVGVIGGVSYALESLPQDHQIRPILEMAFNASDRAAQLTKQMLAYAGKGSFQVENVDLGKVVKATWQLIQASLPGPVDVKLRIRAELPPVHADPTQLQQIVMNLIINAGEAIPEGRPGLVIVSTDVQHIDQPCSTWTSDLEPGDYVVLEVRDNGSGIDPNTMTKIFDPFFTTKFVGRGLGLAAVHGIVRSNKGSIEVDSTVGKGSTFRVLLPAVQPVREKPVLEARPNGSKSLTGRVLLVDDEPIVRNTARAALERAGHVVEVAEGGREAVELVSRSPHGFSLVLLDLGMPGFDGEQTLEALRQINPKLPVVMCSGYGDAEVQNRLRGKSVNGFLQKPFDFRTLKHKVSEWLSPA